MLRTLVLVAQLLAATVVAILVRVARRAFSGPAVPGWNWDVELKAVALRSFIMSAAVHPDPFARAKLEGLGQDAATGVLFEALRQQAQFIGYLDVYHLVFIMILCVTPLVLFLRAPKGGGGAPAPA